MSEEVTSTSVWYKPWWKGLLVIAFFPFTISYLIWKQPWKTPVKIGAIVVLWVVFIGIGSSGPKTSATSNTDQPEKVAQSSPSPSPTITLEQKQADFKTFYTEYQKQAQAVIMVQASLSQLAQLSGSREDLYLALDKMSTIQDNLSSNNVDVPASLKEYKDLSGAAFQVRLAATDFKNAIEAMKVYVNKNDLEKLKSAQEKQQLGESNLSESRDKVEKVAKDLNVDLAALKAESGK